MDVKEFLQVCLQRAKDMTSEEVLLLHCEANGKTVFDCMKEVILKNAELKQENDFLKKDRSCDAGTLNGLGEEFAKVKKQNAELGVLVDAVIDVLEITEDCLSDWTGSSDKAQIGLFKEKLKKIKGE